MYVFAVIVRFIQLIIFSECSPGVTSDIRADSRGHSHLSKVCCGGKRVHNLTASSARRTSRTRTRLYLTSPPLSVNANSGESNL